MKILHQTAFVLLVLSCFAFSEQTKTTHGPEAQYVQNKSIEAVRSKLLKKISTVVHNHLNGSYLDNMINSHMIELAQAYNLTIKGLNTTRTNGTKLQPVSTSHNNKTISAVKKIAQEFAHDVTEEVLQDLTKGVKLKKKINSEDEKRKLAADIEKVVLKNLNETVLSDLVNKTLIRVIQKKTNGTLQNTNTTGRFFPILIPIGYWIAKEIAQEVALEVAERVIDGIIEHLDHKTKTHVRGFIKTIENAVDGALNWVGTAVVDTGKFVATAVYDAGKTVVKTVYGAGKVVVKAAKDTAHFIGKAAHDVAHFIGHIFHF